MRFFSTWKKAETCLRLISLLIKNTSYSYQKIDIRNMSISLLWMLQ